MKTKKDALHSPGECKRVQNVLIRYNIPHDSAIPLLGNCLKVKTITTTKKATEIPAYQCLLHYCPSTEKWKKKMWLIYNEFILP